MVDQYEYTMRDQKTASYHVCDAWNAAYNLQQGHLEYLIPEETGKGRLRGDCSIRGSRILDYDINFREPVEIQGISRTPHLDMLFCLGEHVNWDLPQSGKEFELLHGESYMGVSRETRKRNIYPAERNIHIVEIKLPLSQIQDVVEEFHDSSFVPSGKYQVTPSVQMILQQLINCPYQSSLRHLYLEGKLLELAAVYLNEAVFQTDRRNFSSSLSAEDVKCVNDAKKILDENMIEAPSLKSLSKYVSLNEFKLKKGFKEMYGVSVHAYVIQRRLEYARIVLENNKATVSEVAGIVGYGNVSHFAAAFRKKYGVNPGEYLQSIRK